MPNNNEEILKLIVAFSNLNGGEIIIKSRQLDELEKEIKERIINPPEYWFKTDNENYILNIAPNKLDTLLKHETEYGYEFIRYAIKDDEVIPVSKETLQNILLLQKTITVKCNSLMSETEVIDQRELTNKVSKIKDDVILFVKRNLKFSKEKLWNISPERVENAINKALYEYDYTNKFPMELNIYDSKILEIKYFSGNKKDRRYIEDIDVKDEYFFGNKIRILTLKEDVLNSNIAKEQKTIEITEEPIKNKNEKYKKMLESVITPATSKEIMNAINIKDRETFYNNYLKPAIKEGFIKYTIPEKPRSPKQKYVLTDRGKNFLNNS